MKRWFVPIVAAVAVLALVVGLWWLSPAGPGGSEQAGTTDAPPAASRPDNGLVEPDPGGGGVAPYPGAPGIKPGSPPPGGSGDQGSGGGSGGGSGDQPRMTNPNGVRIDAYDVPARQRLRLHYTIGVPECYGTIDAPVVEETAKSVTITLTRVPPRSTGQVACIEIALTKKVTVALESPLDGRQVRDGSFGGAVVRRAVLSDGVPR